ncbi:hypothetical protein [Crocosphaera sp. XPORK-15E]|uniref:hypothetical protein n=1 Tax=Crocosphaera sp. XPORK-15E TaxID=3110247 RepID=UPI002B1F81D0|nr:hypothetical protein [Crocosphaera sp. XPORK-15E]MEA5534893.1 hypothetical protein [Crocosphaera sp. XPORK-15E]
MLSATSKKIIILRNYFILMAMVTVMITGLGDLFDNPDRMGQKDRLNNYGRYISAGFVNQAQKVGR